MKNITFLLFGFFAIALLSCDTTNGAYGSNENFKRKNDIENPDQSISLVDHLRKVSGVQIDGDGANARIKIRGISSINSGTEPLFVVNGQPLSGGLRDAVQMVPVNEIKSIRVLKNPSEIGFYGVRGANGVIEIAMK